MTRLHGHPFLRGVPHAFSPAAVLAMLLLVPAYARAQDTAEEAHRILKAMSDYLAQQKVIRVTLDSDIEVITPELQKIQFTSSGSALLQRPDHLRAQRAGGSSSVDLAFDGRTVTFHGETTRAYAQFDAPGSVDQLVERLRDQYGIATPGADLLGSDVYTTLTADVVEARHVGRGFVDGIACEHLAFRDVDTDWQIWIEPGERPIPRKYVITSKTLAGGPQYTMRIREWRTDIVPTPDAFAFTPPADAKKVAIEDLAGIDEVPSGGVPGSRQ